MNFLSESIITVSQFPFAFLLLAVVTIFFAQIVLQGITNIFRALSLVVVIKKNEVDNTD